MKHKKRGNKKGYLRMLEAIVAIVVVFGFVLTILPKRPVPTGETPPELESTMKAILDEARINEGFRTCLLLNNDVKIGDVKMAGNPINPNPTANRECLQALLDKSLPAFSPWGYAFAICRTDTSTSGCAIYSASSKTPSKNEGKVTDIPFPSEKSIYTKSALIRVPDVSAKSFMVTGSCCEPPDGPCELNKDLKNSKCIPLEGKVISLYIWEK